MNEIKKTYNIDIYDSKLTIIVTDNVEESCKKLKMETDYNFAGLFSIYDTRPSTSVIIINMKLIKRGTPAHEAFHAVVHIMNYVGITLSESSEEAFAYLLGYITIKIEDTIELYKKLK